MSETDDSEGGRDTGVEQLRLLGLGFALSGIVTYALANAADPQGILVPLLGFLGIATYTLEKTQGYTSGVSFGLIAGGIGVGLWPTLGDPSLGYGYLGSVLIGAGIVNVLIAPLGGYFRRLGERAARRSGEEK